MSFVKFHQTTNRLGKAMEAPGGKRVSDALADAEGRLALVKPPALMAIDAAMDAIGALLAVKGPLSEDALETIYTQANEIHGAAGTFGLAELGKGAWSLCELIDIRRGAKAGGRAAIDAHMDSLRLLRHGEVIEANERRAVLLGLDTLLAHARKETAAA